jgi:hypothetical protein
MRFFHVLKSTVGRIAMSAIALIALGAIMTGCESYTIVTIPPRIDLKQFNTIGVIEFDSPTDAALAKKATQRFIEYVQNAQPGVLILELGSKGDLLQSLGKTQLDADALKAIKQSKSVDFVMYAALNVSNPQTQVSVRNLDLSSISAKESVKADLGVKLYKAASGALAWSNSAQGEWTLAKASLSNIRVNDPEAKYNQMVDDLTFTVTRDFRPTQERRRVEK